MQKLFIACLAFLLGLGWITLSPAYAAVRQLEEAPGQVVYQSRQTLQDQDGNRWQAIAFKRIRPDGSSHMYLRLVSFPGVATVDRSRSLTLTTSLGESLTAADASSPIFTDESAPEPNVGQYDLQPILTQLQVFIPLEITLPTQDRSDRRIPVAPSVLQEWATIATAK